VLSIHNIANASQAEHYFESDNYYTAGEGYGQSEWAGTGAATLRLSGAVQKDDFTALLHGSVGDTELGRTQRGENGELMREHRPGFDLTFSAPKSVSILSEVFEQKDVRAAHEQAVKTALGYIEHEAVQTRSTVNGQTLQEKTGNLVAALFRHDTSRELDPQTHTHAVVMNMTKREDGEWRSISNEEIYRHKMAAGALYRTALASSLQKLGYSIERTGADGTFEVAGFTKKQIAGFSTRSEQVNTELAARGKTRDETSAAEKETIALSTREKKVEVDRTQLRTEWKERANGLGIDTKLQRAVSVGTKLGIERTESTIEARAIVESAIRHVSERAAVFETKDLQRFAYEQATGKTDVASIDRAFQQASKSGELVRLDDDRFTTRAAIVEESRMVDLLKHSKGVTNTVASDLLAARLLDAHEQRSGVQLNHGQRDAAQLILTSSDRFVGVQGYAGSGKTTMLNAVMSAARERGFEVYGMAQSASAASTLGQETGMQASTVERFLIQARANKLEGKPGQQLWVVDESSLLSQRDGSRLMSAALKHGAKVVLVGDVRQMSAVEAGKPFELLIDKGMKYVEMKEIRRQETNQLKAAVAQVIERREQAAFQVLDKNTVEIKPEKGSNDALIARIVGDVRNRVGTEIKNELAGTEIASGKRADTLIITAANRDRHAINSGVRESLKGDGVITGASTQVEALLGKDMTREQAIRAETYQRGDVVRFSRGYEAIGAARGEYARVVEADTKTNTVYLASESGKTIEWRPDKQIKAEAFTQEKRELQAGDKIRATRNGVIEGMKNGDTAYVTRVKGDVVTLRTKTGKLMLEKRELRHIEYAYASTIHASQGKTVNATALHISGNTGQAFGNRAFYVSVTRSRQELTIYTDDKDKAMRAVGREQVKDSALQAVELSRMKVHNEAKHKEREGYERALTR
jgi:conjugative relaxase-like TrwC/TraI family protein